jgi:hypothetical protein
MEIGSTSLLGAGSRCCSRILILPFVLLCLPLFCCCLVAGAAGNFIVGSPGRTIPLLPTLENILPVQTMPVIPAIPTKTPAPGSALPNLDPQAMPLYGSASLASGFSPDPYRVDLEAGGSVDTAGSSAACGYTSFHPAFVLDWQGGDFLRLFFTPNGDDTDTTLLVRTPAEEWLCEKDSVLDLPSAAAGEYAIWVGTREHGTPADGSLSITGSRDVTP